MKNIEIKGKIFKISDHLKKKRKNNQTHGKWPERALHIGRLLPNLVTLAALCMGLTSIHFAFLQNWEKAVASILLAAVLDGIDGRLARFLGNSTDFGAELDSLADFINFGVSPSVLVYFFSLHQIKGLGWSVSLFFSACVAMRLARFNTQRVHQSITQSVFSVGVPAPAGALLALTPVMASFITSYRIPTFFFAFFLAGSALLMLSRYPTFVFKKLTIPFHWMAPFSLCILTLISALLTMPWETLLLISALYVISLPISGYLFYQKK
jgi:CDP-diacylglycerol---serine O-phosphatidyltransferase